MQLRVTCHTDHVGPGSTFVAISGANFDGTAYIPQAIAAGASTLVITDSAKLSPKVQQLCAEQGVAVQLVPDTRKALAELSAEAYGHPARSLKIIGVTGTKGKTTSVFMLADILRALGQSVALLSGVHNRIGARTLLAQLTTPQPDYLHWFFDQCVQAGIEYVVMEASAQAHSLHRVHGLTFDAMIFTNFSQEHAEFYRSQETYFADKAALINQAKTVMLNGDDRWIQTLNSSPESPGAHSFGVGKGLEYRFDIIRASMQGVQLKIHHGDATWSLDVTTIAGEYNCYNAVGVISCLHQLGFSMDRLIGALPLIGPVPGRLERIDLRNGATAVIDYAHTPSSYEAVLSLLRSNTENLIVVFGCGGSRDATKRPLMGMIASLLADLVILTSDNPRTEDNAAIVADIMSGVEPGASIHIEHDRAAAIAYALEQSTPGTIIAILGKGPDEYQIIGSTKLFFSDRQSVESAASYL